MKESDLRKMIRDVFMGMKNNDYDKIYRNTNYGESLIKFVKSKIPNASENDIMLADEAWKNSYLRKRLNNDQLKIYKLLKDFNRSLHTSKSTEWQKNMGLIENKIRSIVRKELKLLKEEQMATLRFLDKNDNRTFTGVMEEDNNEVVINAMFIKKVLDAANIPFQKIQKTSNKEFTIVSGFKGLKYGPKWENYEDAIYSSLENAGWKGEKDKISIYIM